MCWVSESEWRNEWMSSEWMNCRLLSWPLDKSDFVNCPARPPRTRSLPLLYPVTDPLSSSLGTVSPSAQGTVGASHWLFTALGGADTAFLTILIIPMKMLTPRGVKEFLLVIELEGVGIWTQAWVTLEYSICQNEHGRTGSWGEGWNAHATSQRIGQMVSWISMCRAQKRCQGFLLKRLTGAEGKARRGEHSSRSCRLRRRVPWRVQHVRTSDYLLDLEHGSPWWFLEMWAWGHCGGRRQTEASWYRTTKSWRSWRVSVDSFLKCFSRRNRPKAVTEGDGVFKRVLFWIEI